MFIFLTCVICCDVFWQALIAAGVLDPLLETLGHDSSKVWYCMVTPRSTLRIDRRYGLFPTFFFVGYPRGCRAPHALYERHFTRSTGSNVERFRRMTNVFRFKTEIESMFCFAMRRAGGGNEVFGMIFVSLHKQHKGQRQLGNDSDTGMFFFFHENTFMRGKGEGVLGCVFLCLCVYGKCPLFVRYFRMMIAEES